MFVVLGVSIHGRFRSLAPIVKNRPCGRQRRACGGRVAFRQRSRSLQFSCSLASAATHLGFTHGDALAAFGVALFIAVAGFRLGRRTIETLLDAAPQELVPHFQKIITDVPGVIALESLRLRMVGRKVIGEASIAVSRALSIEQAARIKNAVLRVIAADSPQAEITVTAEPRALDDETVIERILLVAARRHLQVHHIITQQVEGRLSISLDMELDGEMALRRAHAIATAFENAIRDEFGADIEIDTHLEPLAPHVMIGRDADPVMLRRHRGRLARGTPPPRAWLHDVHDVRVRGTAAGLVVNYHCRLDDGLTVEAVHDAVDGVERRLREEFPTILRIAGHPEPMEA